MVPRNWLFERSTYVRARFAVNRGSEPENWPTERSRCCRFGLVGKSTPVPPKLLVPRSSVFSEGHCMKQWFCKVPFI